MWTAEQVFYMSKGRKLRVNVGKSKVMWCSQYVNVTLNVEIEWGTIIGSGLFSVLEVTSGSRWRMMSVLSSRGLGINAKKCQYEGVINCSNQWHCI